MPEDLKRVEEVLIAAALAGGKILKEYFRSEKVQAKTKSSYADLVTNADLKSQEAVLRILSRELPGVQIIGEEKENEAVSEEVIYLDPLDGTLNYFHGLNLFAVSIGYWVEKRPFAGMVYNPIDDELYWALSGKGAFRNGEPIRVSQNQSLSPILPGYGLALRQEPNARGPEVPRAPAVPVARSQGPGDGGSRPLLCGLRNPGRILGVGPLSMGCRRRHRDCPGGRRPHHLSGRGRLSFGERGHSGEQWVGA